MFCWKFAQFDPFGQSTERARISLATRNCILLSDPIAKLETQISIKVYPVFILCIYIAIISVYIAILNKARYLATGKIIDLNTYTYI